MGMLTSLITVLALCMQSAYGTLTIEYVAGHGGNQTLSTLTFRRGPTQFAVTAPLIVADTIDLASLPVADKIVVADFAVCASIDVWARACASSACVGVVVRNLNYVADWETRRQPTYNNVPCVAIENGAVLDLDEVRRTLVIAKMDSIEYVSPTDTDVILSGFAFRIPYDLLAVVNAALFGYITFMILAFGLSETGRPRAIPATVAIVSVSELFATMLRFLHLINVGLFDLRLLSPNVYLLCLYSRVPLLSLSTLFIGNALHSNLHSMSKQSSRHLVWRSLLTIITLMIVTLLVSSILKAILTSVVINDQMLGQVLVALWFPCAFAFIWYGRKLSNLLMKPSQLSPSEKKRTQRFANNIRLIGWMEVIMIMLGVAATIVQSTLNIVALLTGILCMESILSYLHLHAFTPRPSIVHRATSIVSGPHSKTVDSQTAKRDSKLAQPRMSREPIMNRMSVTSSNKTPTANTTV